MSTLHSLDALLTETAPQLTEAESTRLLRENEAAVIPSAVASPYSFAVFSFKPLSYLVLLLLLGAGGTVAAAGSAKPGDVLFPLDRATEAVRLALASGDQKTTLQNLFITERFSELQAILNEEKIGVTDATTTAAAGILVRESGESRVANAVAILAAQLAEQTDSAKRDAFLRDLLDQISAVHVVGRDDTQIRLSDTRVKIEDNRAEVRTAGERVRIEEKDGQIEIKVDDRGHDSSSEEGGDDHRSPRATSPSSSGGVGTTTVSDHDARNDDGQFDDRGRDHETESLFDRVGSSSHVNVQFNDEGTDSRGTSRGDDASVDDRQGRGRDESENRRDN